MISFKRFLKDNDIEFTSDQKALTWVKSMKPKSLVRIGSSYFIEEKEINELLDYYIEKQKKIRKNRSIQGKKNYKNRKKPLMRRKETE